MMTTISLVTPERTTRAGTYSPALTAWRARDSSGKARRPAAYRQDGARCRTARAACIAVQLVTGGPWT